MSDNGHQEEQQKVKRCPFLNEYCIKERCALYAGMMKVVGGLQQKFSMCSFGAVVMILSEISLKTQQPPQQQIKIPDLLRGK